MTLTEIPAAFLQGDTFNMTWDDDADSSMDYMNYASLGFSISHEMGHAFDPTGIKFDDNGTYDKWMSNETKARMQENYNCLIYQYGNLTDPLTGLNGNGSLTLAENFADNGEKTKRNKILNFSSNSKLFSVGISTSYTSFQNHLKTLTEIYLLPGFNYTVNQLFWIVNAQVWCTSIDNGEHFQ